MKVPKRKTKDMILCCVCQEPIHIDDFAGFNKKGLFHNECLFKIVYQNPKGFIIGAEFKSSSKETYANEGKE